MCMSLYQVYYACVILNSSLLSIYSVNNPSTSRIDVYQSHHLAGKWQLSLLTCISSYF